MTEPKTRADGRIDLDTTDVDRSVGKSLASGRIKEPVHVNNIGRWALGMQNANPLHYYDEFAAEDQNNNFQPATRRQSFSS